MENSISNPYRSPWSDMCDVQVQKARSDLEMALTRLHENSIQPLPPRGGKSLQDFDDADLVMEMLGRGFVVMPAKDLENKL